MIFLDLSKFSKIFCVVLRISISDTNDKLEIEKRQKWFKNN